MKSKSTFVGLVFLISFGIVSIAANQAQAQFFFRAPVRVSVTIGRPFTPVFAPPVASPFFGPTPLVVPGPFGFPRPVVYPPQVFTPLTVAYASPVYATPVYVPSSIEQAAYVSPVISIPYADEPYASLPFGSLEIPLAPVPDVSVASYAPHGFVIEKPSIASASPQPTDSGDAWTQLLESANQLTRSIASMSEENAEVWSNFLAPDKIITAVERQDVDALAQRLKNYDGVAGNKDLTNIASMIGFAQVRQSMRQIVGTQEDSEQEIVIGDSGVATATQPSAGKAQESSEMVELPSPVPDPQTSQGETQGTPVLATPVKPAE